MEDLHRQMKRKEMSESVAESKKSQTPERRVLPSVVESNNKKDIGETQAEKKYHGNGRFPTFFGNYVHRSPKNSFDSA